MAVRLEAASKPLEQFLARELASPCRIVRMARLSGGTVQDNWLIEIDVGGSRRKLALRTKYSLGVPGSLAAPAEYEVITAAASAGVRVASPIAIARDDSVIGTPFFITAFVDGESQPWKIQRTPEIMLHGDELLEEIGSELARLQTIRPDNTNLGGLKPPAPDTARAAIAEMRNYLDGHDHPHPAIEYSLRWLELNAPPPTPPVLCHGDFRIGNLMIADGHVAAILDWELARWGDPHEDIGWFCMRFFRFGRPDLSGGGIGERAALLRGWEKTRGAMTDPALMRYWDIMASTRWAVVSLQQVARHVSGADPSLELALVGLGTAEMEIEFLTRIERERHVACERGSA